MFSFFLPKRCVACASVVNSNETFCDRCAHIVFKIGSPKCPKCALPRASSKGVDDHCWRCLADKPRFDKCHIAFEYEGAIEQTFKRIKFQKRLAAATPFLDLVADTLGDMPSGRVVVVPSHPYDRWQRGFHVPDLFAKSLDRRFGRFEFINAVARRTRRISRQDLDRDKRFATARSAFRLTRSVEGPVVLIDDVVTTGATVDAVARLLKKGGATRVDVVAIARRK